MEVDGLVGPLKSRQGLISTEGVHRESQVEVLDETVILSIAGLPKERLPASLVTGGIIFLVSAFICPGILLIALIVVPLAALGLFFFYFFAREKLRRAVDKEVLVLTADRLKFYGSCPLAFERGLPNEEDLTWDVAYESLRELKVEERGEEDLGLLIRFEENGVEESFSFGSSLVVPKNDEERERGVEELRWLLGVVKSKIGREI